MAKILVIEDEANIADFVETGLMARGHEVKTAPTAATGEALLADWEPDLVVLDLILPDADGIEVCRRIRSSSDVAVLMLTARTMVDDRVRGLEAGADDYLPKPFAFEELLARIRSVLRRRSLMVEGVVRVADLTIDIPRRVVTRGERVIEMTAREFELLALLAQNLGRPLSRDQIFDRIWKSDTAGESDPVKVYVSYLRQKLNTGDEVDLIQTLRGFGYVLKEPN